MNNFIISKNYGKKGETAVKEYYETIGSDVIDVSEDKDFQKIDVDLIIDGELIEVKTQRSINRNDKIVLELEINYYDNIYRKGWFFTTEANLLIFYDNINNAEYRVKTKELRDLLEKYKHSGYIDFYDYDEEHKTCRLAYIPISFIKKHCSSFSFKDYNCLTA